MWSETNRVLVPLKPLMPKLSQKALSPWRSRRKFVTWLLNFGMIMEWLCEPKHLPAELSTHQVRQLHSEVRKVPYAAFLHPEKQSKSKIMVIEVFSPTECEQVGLQARNIDLVTGQDLTKKRTRDELEEDIRRNPPDLLVLCPPCTDEGGWFHLNSTKWDQLVYAQRVARSRGFIRFCAKLFRIQTDAGRQAIFEHPTGAKTWTYPEIASLCKKFFTVKCHMCQYGLKLVRVLTSSEKALVCW